MVISVSGGAISTEFFDEWAARQVWTDGTSKAMSLAVCSAPFAQLELRRIRVTRIESWIKERTVRGVGGRPLAPGTIKPRYVNVRSVFRAAVRDGLIAIDPTEGVRLPRQRKREATMRVPTPKQVRLLIDAADQRFVAFVAVCAFAGLRLGETAALQIDDVDFSRRQIYVRRQVQRTAGGEIEIRLPKYGSERTIPVPDELLTLLSAHLVLPHRSTWLFAGGEESPPHQNTVGHRWRSTLAAEGLTGYRLHDLRHFYASGLIAAGCDVVTVQRALGLAKATTTLETYSHLWPSAENRTGLPQRPSPRKSSPLVRAICGQRAPIRPLTWAFTR